MKRKTAIDQLGGMDEASKWCRLAHKTISNWEVDAYDNLLSARAEDAVLAGMVRKNAHERWERGEALLPTEMELLDFQTTMSIPPIVELKLPKRRAARTPAPIADTSKLDDDAHVQIHTVANQTGLRVGTIRHMVRKQTFPMPAHKIASGLSYWRLGDIREWLRAGRINRPLNSQKLCE